MEQEDKSDLLEKFQSSDSDGLLEYYLIKLKKDLEMVSFRETTTFLLKMEGPTLIDPIKLKLEISTRLKTLTKFDLYDFNYF